MGSSNPILTQGSWRVGKGYNIPINHPIWFPTKQEDPSHASLNSYLEFLTVADLINQDTASWKVDTIMQIYDQDISQKILSIPLPKMVNQTTQDKIIWPHSSNGDYIVRKTYELLHQGTNTTHPNQTSQSRLWKVLWKLKLPHKIITFTWKLLYHALPVKTELVKRGIHCDPTCCLCNSDNESLNHLFLHCTFAIAVWLGADINIRIPIERMIPVQTWIHELAKMH